MIEKMEWFCLGTGEVKCDGCQKEKNWQMLNQMDDALRKSIQQQAIRVNEEECIIRGRPFYER